MRLASMKILQNSLQLFNTAIFFCHSKLIAIIFKIRGHPGNRVDSPFDSS